MDWTALNAAIDFTAPLAFLGAAAIALIGFYVSRKGFRLGSSVVK